MGSILDLLTNQLSGGVLDQVSSQVGADPQTTQTALSAALPLLLSGLAHNASQPQGAQALHQALTQDHDGSILDNTQQYVSNPAAANGAGIVGHIFGGQSAPIEQQLAQHTGMSSNQIDRILEFAAPLVMGYLGRQVTQQGLDTHGLQNMLGQQQQQVQGNLPGGLGSLLGSLLGGQGGGSDPRRGSGSGNLV
jgi:hypothetical protein